MALLALPLADFDEDMVFDSLADDEALTDLERVHDVQRALRDRFRAFFDVV